MILATRATDQTSIRGATGDGHQRDREERQKPPSRAMLLNRL